MLVKSTQQHRKRSLPTKLAVAALLACLVAPLSVASTNSQVTLAKSATATPETTRIGTLPIAFEPNAGQTEQQVRFMAHAPGGTMYFAPSEVVLSLVAAPVQPQPADSGYGDRPDSLAAPASPPSVVRMQFVSSSPNASMTGSTMLQGKVNYLIGDDPSKWNLGLPTYGNITYSDLYQGTDLTYNGTDGQLKGTYTVASGANPSLIQWSYDGAKSVSIDGEGNLVVVTGAANGGQAVTVTERAPVAWQTINGEQVPVSVSYLLQRDNTIGFQVGRYDATQPLTIDPTLLYSTYLGANGTDYGLAIASDEAGNVWTTGYTSSTNFPILPNPGAFQGTIGLGYDSFVTKTNTNATGASSLVYSTYLGGNGNDFGRGIAVDASGNAYIVGQTLSNNFPLLGQYQGNQPAEDVFVTKLNAGGMALLYSTYIGGTGVDNGLAIAVSGTQAFITGSTESPNFPRFHGFYTPEVAPDVFVTRFNTALTGNASLIYSEIYSGDGFDYGYGIATDGLGNVYVTGDTSSADLPATTNRLQDHNNGGFLCTCDSFLIKIDTNSSGADAYKYATYIGTVNDDYGRAIAADASGNAYLAGETGGLMYHTANGYEGYSGYGDGWVLRINTNLIGNAVVTYGTNFGGVWGDAINGIDIDAAGNIYVSGHTTSPQNVTPHFPLRDAYQSVCGGCVSAQSTIGDAFVAKFNPNAPTADGSLIYSTYLGGSTQDGSLQPDDIASGISVDNVGNAYVVGSTNAANFPVVNGYLTNSPYGVNTTDSFIAKLGVAVSPTNTPVPPTATRTATRTSTPVASPTRTATRTATRTNTPISTPTRTSTRTNTPVATPTRTPSRTNTPVATLTRTATRTNTPTATPTRTATRTNTPVPPSPTRTNTPLPTQTPGGSTATPVPTNTNTPIPPSATHTSTPVPATSTPTNTPVPPTATNTNTPLPTQTPGGATATTVPSATDTPVIIETATPTETPGIQPCTVQFADVPPDSTFYQFVRCLACRNILGGYSDGTFRTGNNVTRGQLAKIASNAAAFTEDPGSQLFQDVTPDSTFYLFVQRLASRGYIGGYACGASVEPCGSDNLPYFRPGANATRGQISKIVSNAAGFSEPPIGQTFEDVPPASVFYVWVQRLTSKAIMSGYPCGGSSEPCGADSLPYFRPGSNATRGQTAKIVSNTFFPNCQTP